MVSLEPVIGREIGKTRPAIVISNDRNNEFADTITVLPITSRTQRLYPFETLLPKKETKIPKDSKVKCNQTRTIEKRRFVKFICKVSERKMREIEDSTLIHLGISI